jgi:hypothetical protein
MAADHKFKSITTEGTENTEVFTEDFKPSTTKDTKVHEGKQDEPCIAYQSAVLCGARWVLVMRSCQESWSSSR